MSEIFRDRSEGVSARRQDLLRKRRDELVTMPHAVRRVIVARTARIAASLAVMVAGTALVAVAMRPGTAAWLAKGLPGIQPAVLSTLVAATWALGLATWAISRARSEHKFAVAMSKYVLPSQDVDQDIERLSHERPDEAAREMAHRLEVRSAALPVIAAAMLLPATALYIAQGIHAHGWPRTASYEAALAANSHALAIAAVAGLFTAVIMTRRTARLPIIAPIAAVVAVTHTGLAIAMFGKGPGVLWWFAIPASLATAIAIIARRLRAERKLIAADDPAAGSEVFTIKGMLRRLRAAAVAVRNACRPAELRRVFFRRRVAVAAVSVAGVAAFFAARGGHAAKVEPAPIHPLMQAALAPNNAQHSKPITPSLIDTDPYDIKSIADGKIRIEIHPNGQPIDLDALGGLEVIPVGWHANVRVAVEGALPAKASLRVTPFGGYTAPGTLSSGITELTFTADVCNRRVQPMNLVLDASDWPAGQSATLVIEPSLELASCQ